MRCHIEFATPDSRRLTFDGIKYMQKDGPGGLRSIGEILADYTTLYCHVAEHLADGGTRNRHRLAGAFQSRTT